MLLSPHTRVGDPADANPPKTARAGGVNNTVATQPRTGQDLDLQGRHKAMKGEACAGDNKGVVAGHGQVCGPTNSVSVQLKLKPAVADAGAAVPSPTATVLSRPLPAYSRVGDPAGPKIPKAARVGAVNNTVETRPGAGQNPDRHCYRPSRGAMKCEACADYNKGVVAGHCQVCGHTNSVFLQP